MLQGTQSNPWNADILGLSRQTSNEHDGFYNNIILFALTFEAQYVICVHTWLESSIEVEQLCRRQCCDIGPLFFKKLLLRQLCQN